MVTSCTLHPRVLGRGQLTVREAEACLVSTSDCLYSLHCTQNCRFLCLTLCVEQ